MKTRRADRSRHAAKMILRVCLENFPVGSIWRSPQFYRRPHSPARMPHFVSHCVEQMTHNDAKNDAKGPAESHGERAERRCVSYTLGYTSENGF